MKNSSFKIFMELHNLATTRNRKKHILDKYLLSAQTLHSFMCEGARVSSTAILLEQFNAYVDRVLFQYKSTANSNSLKRFLNYWTKQLRLAKPESITTNISDTQQTLEVLTSYNRLQEIVFDVLLKMHKDRK